MGNIKTNGQITYTKAYLSIGFRKLLFPIDVRLFLNILPEEGYILEEDVFKIRRRFGGQITISGDIARKGDFRLAINSEKGFIGVDGPEPLSVVEEISTLTKVLEDRLQIDLESTASFYEFLADGSLKTTKPPLETFLQASEAFLPMAKISKAFGENVSFYGLRLASAGQEPNQPDFLDIRIEPNIVHTRNFYSFSATYRMSEFDKVAEFAKGFSSKLTDIIRILEQTE